MNFHWLFRMARWARNPPSATQVKLVLAIIAVCVGLFALEQLYGLPDWMAVEPRGPRYRP